MTTLLIERAVLAGALEHIENTRWDKDGDCEQCGEAAHDANHTPSTCDLANTVFELRVALRKEPNDDTTD